LDSRLLKGSLKLNNESPADVLVGVGLARNLNLQVGDTFKMVIPIYSEIDPNQFHRRIETFKVGGILDLGKNEYNERLIISSLQVVQKFAEIGNQFSGFLLRFKDVDRAPQIAAALSRQMGADYRVRDWHEINENLFEAVKIERSVIFFVIMVIVLAAAFNVASSLYINVVRKYQELAILKAVGFTPSQIIKVFSVQGVLLGALGTFLGISFGLVLCVGFVWLEKNYGVIPGSVYRIDHIDPHIRAMDLIAIIASTLLLSWLATLAPARKGAKMTPVEGLRHE
jgi:lipoprotein-releasing system permease protein